MSTFQRIEGVVYYNSLSELLSVRERLNRGSWLDDADRWRGRDGEMLRDDPATNYHPVLPTLEIPYHTARNLGPRKLLSGNGTETAVLILSTEQFANGTVKTADDSWGIDLIEWACDNTDLLSRDADSGDVIEVKTGVPIDEDHPEPTLVSELQDAFHSEYDHLVPTETCAQLQRVSRDDL